MIESIFLHPWVWILPAVMVILLAFTVVAIILNRDDPYGTWGICAVPSGFTFLAIAAVYFAVLLPPYDVTFYQTYQITGEVTEKEAAISSGEGTMSQSFIAKVEGVDYYIRSDDQRFRTLDVGDDANLVCGKKFAYFQEPWYDCSFAG